MDNRTYKFVFATGIIAGLLLGCHSSERKDDAVTPPEAPPAAMVAVVTKGKLSSTIKIPGELQPFQQVDLYAKVSSYIKRLYADVGSEVKQGQLLATMEAPEINSQVSASQSHVRSYEAVYIASKANYDRLVETSKTPGTISPNDLDMANARQKSDYAQYEAAKSAYNEVMNTRDYLQVRAPFSGVISARNVSEGAYVGPSGKGSEVPMFTLQTQHRLRLAVSVPELYTSYLNDKSEVSFTVVSQPNQVFTAKVKRLAGALDQRFRSERIEMDILNDSKKLLPGMVAEIIIPLPARDSTLLVPETAIVNSTEKVYLIKVIHNRAEWVKVQKGRASGKEAEVFGNISAGDTIVAEGSEEIRDSMRIGKTTLYRNTTQ